MSNQQTVSVAIATYNGEKYLEEQLVSILRQTRPVQEIVISDDGSKDNTLAVACRIAESPEAKGIRFVYLQDNPRHGAGGNFEWALTHCSGDFIFVCGQDDVWEPKKVERILNVFLERPDALCVLHNADCIDEIGDVSDKAFLNPAGREQLLRACSGNEPAKLGTSFFHLSVANTLVVGIAIAIRKQLLETLLPFPTFAEDQWIELVALAQDGCYFLNEKLAYYRKHSDNTSGRQSTGIKRVFALISRLKHNGNRGQKYMYSIEYPRFCLAKLEQLGKTNDEAYVIAQIINEIGVEKQRALDRGGISGVIVLVRLFRNNLRYRRSGFWDFFLDVCFLLQKS